MKTTFHKVIFYGDCILTTVTSSGSFVDAWIAGILHRYRKKLSELIIGLDTEWSLPTEKDSHQKVAILQLCVGRRCIVFQLCHADYIPPSLVTFLGDENFTFVGKGIATDLCKLVEDHNLHVGHAKDLGYWAAAKYHDKELRRLGLRALTSEFLHCKVLPKDKNITLSNWTVEKLSNRQIEYACLDAFVSFKIGISLSMPRPSYD